MSYFERCPECGALGKIDEDQFLGKVSIECSGCRHHYHKEKAVIKLKTIRIKYLRKGGTRSTTFWSERELGQVIEEDAFEGLIDEVLEIEGIPDTTSKPQQPKIVYVKEVPRSEAKERVIEYFKEHSEADLEDLMINLKIPVRILVDVIDELRKEGTLSPVGEEVK